MLLDAPCRNASVQKAVHHFSLRAFSKSTRIVLRPAVVCGCVMSECMSVTNKSGRPSRSKSKNFTPIAPHGVLGK